MPKQIAENKFYKKKENIYICKELMHIIALYINLNFGNLENY